MSSSSHEDCDCERVFLSSIDWESFRVCFWDPWPEYCSWRPEWNIANGLVETCQRTCDPNYTCILHCHSDPDIPKRLVWTRPTKFHRCQWQLLVLLLWWLPVVPHRRPLTVLSNDGTPSWWYLLRSFVNVQSTVLSTGLFALHLRIILLYPVVVSL